MLLSVDRCFFFIIKNAKEEARQEQKQYSKMKKLRWTLLTKADSLSVSKAAHLAEILDSHSGFAVCYAMKKEMCSLFDLRDPVAELIDWENGPLPPRKAVFLLSSGSLNQKKNGWMA